MNTADRSRWPRERGRRRDRGRRRPPPPPGQPGSATPRWPATRSACVRCGIIYAVVLAVAAVVVATIVVDRLQPRRDQPRARSRRSPTGTGQGGAPGAVATADAGVDEHRHDRDRHARTTTARSSPTTRTPCADATPSPASRPGPTRAPTATVCTAIQDQGVTVAVYQLHGNCDELTALDSDTGAAQVDPHARQGRRRVRRPGQLLRCSRATSCSCRRRRSTRSPSSGSTDDGNGGLDYWTFHHAGCTHQQRGARRRPAR